MNLVGALSRAVPFGALKRGRALLEGAEFRLRLLRRGAPPLPRAITVDPGNVCNLRCPLCPTGAGRLDYERGFMTLEIFRAVLERFPKLRAVGLFNWGEPLLHPQILAFIRLAKRRGLYAAVHSNFSLRKPAPFFCELVDSGLDQLTLSIDGATPEGYARYRVGGDFGLAMENLRSLLRAQSRRGSRSPRVIWKFLVHRGNERELPEARRRAAALGVEFLESPIGLGDDLPDLRWDEAFCDRARRWLPDRRVAVPPSPRRGPCPQLFETLVVQPDGKVSPCCYATSRTSVFGDLKRESAEAIWRGPAYRYSRGLFTGRAYSGPRIETVCARCGNFTKCAEA